VVIGLFFSLAVANGQFAFPGQNSVQSISGQFVVSSVADSAPLIRNPATMAGTNIVRLEPALLAVAAERFKLSVWQQLGLPFDASWSGKIFLTLHPARSLDETVTITSNPFLNRWNYRVEFPDALANTRYARALSAVLLLEIANRTAAADGHGAEIPAWLVDGLAQQVLADDGEKVILSAPAKKIGGLPVSRLNQAEHDFDPFAGTRQVLQNLPVLTFDELSWPTAAQLDGDDGGAYFANAQLFLHELLVLKNGPARLRALLAELPTHLNWQTAFFDAFHDDFKRPLDVEKWWALRVVNFAARAPGPRWTTVISRGRLESLLNVPVEVRSNSNALPTHAEISLQAAFQNLSPAQRDMVARIKLRDLMLVELRLAPPFGELADGYRVALAGFLGEHKKAAPVSVTNKQGSTMNRGASLKVTLKKLDALDRRRREAEVRSTILLPGNSGTVPPNEFNAKTQSHEGAKN
jgi:hypothetical protein